MRAVEDKPTFWAMKLDEEDRKLLELCAKKDERSMAAVMRRGLELYAKSLGIPVKRTRPRRGRGRLPQGR